MRTRNGLEVPIARNEAYMNRTHQDPVQGYVRDCSRLGESNGMNWVKELKHMAPEGRRRRSPVMSDERAVVEQSQRLSRKSKL
ncbi:hypothetical protein PRIPAC_84892 [Pristionchus pacificus]|uniref:Uncharacterized protein n=1 Tax=Pristionchus pacificus TaxID=54126 RepID=A0A2A6CEN2_PRIPA|nr:hypothetical protein PRIPAC_84892 [Pristionchus pacificus]|eukprot:PDM76560.1 hypothetical protein PRIPAC_42926 [Pristionchus pacificus]